MPEALDPADRTRELREAHDVLAEVYADRLATILDEMPLERALLALFAELVRGQGGGVDVLDVGCGTGRLAPFLAAQGLAPRGVDLSEEMVRVARRDHPEHSFEVADLRSLPGGDAAVDGAVAWYSLLYLPPDEQTAAFVELARVLKPGGHLAMAFKVGDDTARRGGRSLDLGIEFDVWWHSPEALRDRLTSAGFDVVAWAGRPADPAELQPQGYVVARRRRGLFRNPRSTGDS